MRVSTDISDWKQTQRFFAESFDEVYISITI